MAINSYKHVDVNSSGGGDGSSWNLSGPNAAYNLAEFENFLENTVVAGDVIFVKGGTYNFTGDIDSNLRDGLATSPIAIIGVKSSTTNTGANITYSDWARSASDRPFFNTGAYRLRLGDYYILRNFRIEGASDGLLWPGSNCTIENCKAHNNYPTSAARNTIYANNYNNVVNCEISSSKTRGIRVLGTCRIIYCYIHDIADTTNGHGISVDGLTLQALFNIFNNCYIGIYATADHYGLIVNNTFYGCGTAVSATTDTSWVLINNIVEGSTTVGVKWTTQTDINFFWKNHGDDIRNVDMWSGVDETTLFKDYECSAGDPKFVNPSASNFSLQSSSPCLNTGMSIELGVS